jgi:hypothetical protein
MLSSEFWPDFLPAGKDFTIPAPNFLPAGIPFLEVSRRGTISPQISKISQISPRPTFTTESLRHRGKPADAPCHRPRGRADGLPC